MAKVNKNKLPEVHIDIGSHNYGRNPIGGIQLPNDAVSVGYKETRPYHIEQVFYSPSNNFTGTEKEFVAAGLGYKFTQTSKHTRTVNPAPRIGTARPRCRSQITGKAPSKRLVTRRKANTRKGYFPNPINEKYMLILGNAITVAESRTSDKQVMQARLSYVQGLVTAGEILDALKKGEGEIIMENLRGKLNAS